MTFSPKSILWTQLLHPHLTQRHLEGGTLVNRHLVDILFGLFIKKHLADMHFRCILTGLEPCHLTKRHLLGMLFGILVNF
jgi:hypothetical protein